MSSKNNKVAIVTGASSGIGLAIAKKLASNNISTILVSRSPNKLRGAKKIILKNIKNKRVICLPADVGEKNQVEKIVERVINKFGTVDYLINSAGISIQGNFHEIDERDWDEVANTNLKGVFLCCKAVWPIMLKNKGAHIITISSASGITGYPSGSIYCASKFGLNGFMEALSAEGQEVGIKVTNICPGQVDSPIWNLEDPVINKARKDMLKAESISDLVWYILNRPRNEHFRKVEVHPFKLQPNLRGRNKGPGGKFPKHPENLKEQKNKFFII